MSSAFQRDFTGTVSDPTRIFFWIRPVDDKGFAVEQAFADAAYSKAQELRLYRWRELNDEAVRADLVERAVYAASRAQRAAPIDDPKGYIYTAFTRLVDRYISKQSVSRQPESEIEQLPEAGIYATSGSLGDLDDAILRSQILKAMSPEDRWAWERRLLGYEVQEIAAELRVSPDCLSTRLRRSAREAAHVLHLPARARQ